MIDISPGIRLKSIVCKTEVVVVRGSGAVELSCGGSPMRLLDDADNDLQDGPRPGLDAGTALGKRYVAADNPDFEVLITKNGAGTLAVAGTPMILKEAKPLPSSD